MGDWDYHYRCALSYIEGRFYDEAAQCLEKALAQRSEDKWNARAYGYHFLDYFPNRERGLVHFYKGEYEAARRSLELSISQEPSDKAFHFLDLVRRKTMLLQGLSAGKPQIAILSAGRSMSGEKAIKTRSYPFSLTGEAFDERYVSEIRIEAKDVFVGYSRRKLSFEKQLFLEEGEHGIEIEARNLLGGVSKSVVRILADRSGPVVTITKIEPGGYIEGYLDDLSADGVFFDPPPAGNIFRILLSDSRNRVELSAIDELGNATTDSIDVSGRFALRPAPLFASWSPLAASDAESGFDAGPPAPIAIETFSPKRKNVFKHTVRIGFKVKRNIPLESITVNGTALEFRHGRISIFSHFAKLRPGRNDFSIRARSESGLVVSKEFFLIREIPEHEKRRYRYRIRLTPFENVEDADQWPLFMHGFETRLLNGGRFRLMADQKNEEVRPETSRPSHALVAGAVRESAEGTEIVTRLVCVKTSQVLAVVDAFEGNGTQDKWNVLADTLSEKYHGAFPRAGGVVEDIEHAWFSPRYVVSCEGMPGRRPWPYMVFREAGGGTSGENADELGRNTVVLACDCLGEKCDALFEANSAIRIGDRVMTQ